MTYVVPSRRVARELSRKIAEKQTSTYFEPYIYSVEEYVGIISDLSPIDEIDLQFHFYKVYQNLQDRESTDSFETFLSWAPKLIQDFEEVDRHLVPAKEIFNYLGDVKELETREWMVGGETSPMVRRFVEFWKSVPRLYDELYQSLLKNGQGYSGMLYREAFAKAREKKLTDLPNLSEHHVFLGLNALNKAEEEIIKLHLERGTGSVFWDFDQYFQENSFHEAGKFLRHYTNHWEYYKEHQPEILEANFSQPKVITIEGISGKIGLAQRAAAIAQQWVTNGENLSNKVLVLADEQLLVPLMNALPAELESVNITMGQTLSSTQIVQFFESLLDVLLQLFQDGKAYHRDIINIENTYLALFGNDADRTIQDMAVKNNLAYVTHENLLDLKGGSELIEILRATNRSLTDIYQRLLGLCDVLKERLVESDQPLMLEQLYGVYSTIKVLELRSEQIDLENPGMVTRIFKDLLSRKRLNYLGDQQDGLQIMGLLETRALDYEEIILLSANEGILPAGKSQNSYIPLDIQIEYGLPTYREKDSIYSYHLYRLLQRTKKATLLYDTDQNSLGSSEKSRFLEQLLADPLSTHKVSEKSFTSPLRTNQAQPRIVEKTPELVERLNGICKTGFSPSSLASYLRNPYQFYLQKVLGVEDAAEVEESMAYNTMGTLVHEVLEDLYQPCLNRPLTVPLIEKMRGNVSDLIQVSYKKHVGDNDNPSGLNLILYHVAEHYVQRMLDMDQKVIKAGHELVILELERKMNTYLNIPAHGKVKIKGTVDRIDQLNGNIRVIDYKTGRVEARDLQVNLDDKDELLDSDKYAKALQVLAYAKMYMDNNKLDHCLAGIISFKNLAEGFMAFKDNSNRKNPMIDQGIIQRFEEVLSTLLGEILNPDLPFTENTET